MTHALATLQLILTMIFIVYWVWRYIQFRKILHHEGLLDFHEDGLETGENIFSAWQKLPAQYKTRENWLIHFGWPISMVLAGFSVVLYVLSYIPFSVLANE